MKNTTTTPSSHQINSLPFVKELVKYYMAFLETDFHKQKIPKRHIKQRDKDNLQVSINLKNYPTFEQEALQILPSLFSGNPYQIEKGHHKTVPPKQLFQQINEGINKIMPEDLAQVRMELMILLNEETTSHREASKIKDTILQHFVKPFFKKIEHKNANELASYAQEITNLISTQLKNNLILLIKDTEFTREDISNALNLNQIKRMLRIFFEDLKVKDLFNEVSEIKKNSSLLTHVSFYFYFFDITFEGTAYPIFYIPFQLTTKGKQHTINFDNRLYVNSKALAYIINTHNKQHEKKEHLKSIGNRIIYLNTSENPLEKIQQILDELSTIFKLQSSIDISQHHWQAHQNLYIKVSNTCHIALCEQADEAIVNDYEAIIDKLNKQDHALIDAMCKIVDDFLHTNPRSFNHEITTQWQEASYPDQLLSSSPIPLNSEQRQLLYAIDKEECRYITLEGPPGTGKSHTITAVLFNALQQKKTVLVLSDKKEALDVVESKVSQTLNSIQKDAQFVNPILRIGKTGNTYANILSSKSIKKMSQQYLAVKKEYPQLLEGIKKKKNALRQQLENEVNTYQKIDMEQVRKFILLDQERNKQEALINLPEVMAQKKPALDLQDWYHLFNQLKHAFKLPEGNLAKLLNALEISPQQVTSFEIWQNIIDECQRAAKIVQGVHKVFIKPQKKCKYFTTFSTELHKALQKNLQDYKRIRGKLFVRFPFKYFFHSWKKKPLRALNIKFQTNIPANQIPTFHKKINTANAVNDIFTYVAQRTKQQKPFNYIDPIRWVHFLLLKADNEQILTEALELKRTVDILQKFQQQYPKTFQKMGIFWDSIEAFCTNKLFNLSEAAYKELVAYLFVRKSLQQSFKAVPSSNFYKRKTNLEHLLIRDMAYRMQERILNLHENYRNDIKTLHAIIRQKRKFPKNEFEKLQQAFPCIMSSLRDYAEYIPLEPCLFDLIIIDEASQVSIAQAFPALLRAKKVLILGDLNQFSNVKALNARKQTNETYLASLRDLFCKHISRDQSKLAKLAYFNIRSSILKFADFISNYQNRLVKHFRSYKEIISYANKVFYDDLQVMKIRHKPIDEVLRFSFVQKKQRTKNNESNTNQDEIDYIVDQLAKFKENDSKISVGIITPHRNQQRALLSKIYSLANRDYYLEVLNLKVMTFDTCQGEERDYIFYSMVASLEEDRLNHIFTTKNVEQLSSDQMQENIRVQRLNVGFSRAKETMHFVLSQPLDNFRGSIGHALRNYYSLLQTIKNKELKKDENHMHDQKKNLVQWLQQTDFWRKRGDKLIKIHDDFTLGVYMGKLGHHHSHPSSSVDLLIHYRDTPNGETKKLIISYEPLIRDTKSPVDAYHRKHYLSPEDLYRQKALESYGYTLLNLNRIQLMDDVVAKLDGLLKRVEERDELTKEQLIANIYKNLQAL